MTVSVSPLISDVMTDLRSFLTGFLPSGTPIVQGIQNRVSMPQASGFVLMTPLMSMRLATNVASYVDTFTDAGGTQSDEQDTRFDVQIDCYGPNAGDWAAMISTLFRGEYGCNAMVNCQPLYIDDFRLMPLIDAEKQYENRWTATAVLQYNPVTTIDQQFAGAATATLIDAEEAYPP